MTNFFPQHVALIQQRWPHLLAPLQEQDIDAIPAELIEGRSSTLAIDGIQLSSRHDRVREARLQAEAIPLTHKALTLYGIGLGDLPRELLKRKQLELLSVKVMNRGLFAMLLHLLDHSDWLSDPRVTLSFASDDQWVATPYTAIAAELELADEPTLKLRDRLVIEIKRNLINNEFAEGWMAERLQSNRQLISQDQDVSALFTSRQGSEAYVIATGPTLAQHYATLKLKYEQRERPLFICVDTALRPLLEHGIRPDIVVSMDRCIDASHLLPEHSADMALVYIPMVPNDVLAAWQGTRYVAYEALAPYDALRKELPRSTLYSGGSVIHPAMDLAVQMGASKITLLGADFAFPGGKTHSGWDDGVLGPKASTANRTVMDGHGRQVRTLLSFCIYLNYMEYYISKQTGIRFFNGSRDGAKIQGTEYNQEFAL